jgi:histidine triad (HIT) family protein
MTDCPFCAIAKGTVHTAVVWDDADIVIFLDTSPIREGHCQIIPRKHIDTFENLPADLASKILSVGQRLAKRMKDVYAADHVAFLFTGGDIPHVHAHVVPMHEKTDITSARYITNCEDLKFRSAHLKVDQSVLAEVREKLKLK